MNPGSRRRVVETMPELTTSVDVSLYPLHADYKAPILEFIRALQATEGVTVLTNPLSTQVYGPFEHVWATLGRLLPEAFGADFNSVVVLKVVSVDVTE